MDALTVDRELAAIARQTRRLTMWSTVAHLAGAVGFLFVAAHLTRASASYEALTEITWEEPTSFPAAVLATTPTPAATVAPTPAEISTRPSAVPRTRAAASAPAATAPASPALAPPAGADLVQQRLAALRAGDRASRVVALAGGVPAPRTQVAAVPIQVSAPPRELRRAATTTSASLTTLPRATPTVVAAVSAPPPLPKPDVAAAPTREVQPGVQLAGEVSGRALQEHAIPQYPQWAQRDGIEVSVRLHFTVLPDGRVKENVRVEQTSGYDEFDRLARAALARWRFASLPPGAIAEQWGRVEFKYRLRNAG